MSFHLIKNITHITLYRSIFTLYLLLFNRMTLPKRILVLNLFTFFKLSNDPPPTEESYVIIRRLRNANHSNNNNWDVRATVSFQWKLLTAMGLILWWQKWDLSFGILKSFLIRWWAHDLISKMLWKLINIACQGRSLDLDKEFYFL